MCKFTNRLFVFAFTLFFVTTDGATLPTGQKPSLSASSSIAASRNLLDLLLSPDYDLHYDQRQKGGENFRLSMDGFFIGIPADQSSGLVVLTDDLINSFSEEFLSRRSSAYNSDNGHLSDVASVMAPKPDSKRSSSKLLEDFQYTNQSDQHKSTTEEDFIEPQKNTNKERLDFDQSSRTKLHVVNLLDFIRRNRRV